jgi:hypothetical protein
MINVQAQSSYYESTEYPLSYQPYYKTEYQSYDGKNNNYNNYKSFKDSNSLFLKKNKCNNNNVNINGDNTADFNIGSHGQTVQPLTTAEAEEDLSSNAFGVYDERNNNNGFKNTGKFDADCSINNDNNNAGGQGGIGPQGPQGERGPPGSTEFNTANYYKVSGIPVSGVPIPDPPNPPPTTLTVTSSVSCRSGDVAISGSYIITPLEQTDQISVLEFSSTGEPLPTGWKTTIHGPVGTSISTTVLCFDNP